MLDPGRYLAEAIYFLQYTLANILWAINRAFLSIAVIAESINSWVTDNVGYFVQLLVNALSAPLGGMFILALTALGFWYALNNVVPTGRWVDPSKLFTYGLIAFFFFSSPIIVIDMMEDLRQSLNAGIDTALIDNAAGDIFDTSMDGTDTGLPGTIPDVNSDGVIGSFDLVTAFMLVANMDELDSSEFPVDFEATYFSFGDPSGIDLTDEADQELAKAQASEGIERLFFALVAIPTAIAEHFLRLSLTGVAMFLYAGVPFAMLFAFFIYTQAFLGAYLRQFIHLMIETLMSVIIAAIMIGLLAAAAQQGMGLYIGAGIITLIVLLWRIKSALKLAAAAFDLFGGAMLTGGSGGMALANMGRQAVTGAVGVTAAALTGGATVAAGGALLASAAALRADGQAEGAYLGTDPDKTDGRVRQLKTIAGYALGRSDTTRHLIENGHELRTFARNFRDGAVQEHEPDTLDYLRAGSSMSGFGSSPWMAMRVSPSLRAAFDEIGGRSPGAAIQDDVFEREGEPVTLLESGADQVGQANVPAGDLWRDEVNSEHSAAARPHSWRLEPATPLQLDILRELGVGAVGNLTRGQASELINRQRRVTESTGGNVNDREPNPDWLHRMAGLEQAIVHLTYALTNAESFAPAAARHVDEAPGEMINGPLPDWLLGGDDNAGGADAAQDGSNTVIDAEASSALLRHPRKELDQDSRNTTSIPPTTTGTVRLEPYHDARRRTIHDTLARLEDPHSPAGQAAMRTLVTFTGQQNAAHIQEAVGQHSAEVVQAATSATADLVTRYRTQGLSDADVLATFQSGEAATSIRETEETPLSDDQLAAVADMVLLPQRRLTRTELVTIIGRQVAAGSGSEQAVVQAIGSPVGFGGQTGNVRGVMTGARSMTLSPDDLTRLAALIGDGLREQAQDELVGRGYRPEQVREFVSDVAALPGTMVVPQTTAVRPQQDDSA